MANGSPGETAPAGREAIGQFSHLSYADGPTFREALAAGYEVARLGVGQWDGDARFTRVWSLHRPEEEGPVIAVVHLKVHSFGHNFTPSPKRADFPSGPIFEEWAGRRLVIPVGSLVLSDAVERFELPSLGLETIDYQRLN